jgi:hypothetical protein
VPDSVTLYGSRHPLVRRPLTSFTVTWLPADHQVNMTIVAVEAAEGHRTPS